MMLASTQGTINREQTRKRAVTLKAQFLLKNENRRLNNSPCREAQRSERCIKTLATVTAVDELRTDTIVNEHDHHHEKKLNVPCWIPHPRTGIYYPKGQERVMDVVPNGAASFHPTYWLRSVDGTEDKPSPDSGAWLHDHPLLICHNNVY